MRVKLGEIIHSNYWNQPFWNELNITFETSEIRLFEWVKSDFWNEFFHWVQANFWNEWNIFVKMSEMHFWNERNLVFWNEWNMSVKMNEITCWKLVFERTAVYFLKKVEWNYFWNNCETNVLKWVKYVWIFLKCF